MRTVFVGAGKLAVATARLFLERGHEVVFLEIDRERIEELSDEVDAGFLHGDGTRPALLREAGPQETDLLFCMTEYDPVNIIAGLVGQSLGYERVVVRIQDPDYEGICGELGLEETIVPIRTIARYLADMAEGIDVLELSTVLRADARFFTSTLPAGDAGPIEELDLPAGARVICFYRDGAFHLVEGETELKEGDEIVVLAHREALAALRERWRPRTANDGD